MWIIWWWPVEVGHRPLAVAAALAGLGLAQHFLLRLAQLTPYLLAQVVLGRPKEAEAYPAQMA